MRLTGLVALCALAAPATCQQMDQLKFLSGCWAAQSGGTRIEEQWSSTAGGMLLGFSRAIKDGKVSFFEFIRIEQTDGRISYIVQVSGGAQAVAFPLLKLSPTEAVFENLKHDFPQRIIYRPTQGGLAARIEASAGGQTKGQDFAYQRVACP